MFLIWPESTLKSPSRGAGKAVRRRTFGLSKIKSVASVAWPKKGKIRFNLLSVFLFELCTLKTLCKALELGFYLGQKVSLYWLFRGIHCLYSGPLMKCECEKVRRFGGLFGDRLQLVRVYILISVSALQSTDPSIGATTLVLYWQAGCQKGHALRWSQGVLHLPLLWHMISGSTTGWEGG